MKRIKKTDLLDLKIKISCTNEIAYMDCALLLDKPEFLSLIPDLRKKYGIKEQVHINGFVLWLTKLVEEDTKKLDKDLADKSGGSDDLSELNLIGTKFQQETDRISRKFKRPSYFSSIIQYAIVCGEVNDSSYQHTNIEIFPKYELTPDDNPLPEVKINITPMTTLSDVKRVFEQNVPRIFEENKKNLKYYYKMKNRPSANIRRDREWYWRNLAGDGYTQIALSETSESVRQQYEKDQNRYQIPEYEMVKQAIRRYKRYLMVYI